MPETISLLIGYLLITGGSLFIAFNFLAFYIRPIYFFIRHRSSPQGSSLNFLGTIPVLFGWALLHPVPRWLKFIILLAVAIDTVASLLIAGAWRIFSKGRHNLDQISNRERMLKRFYSDAEKALLEIVRLDDPLPGSPFDEHLDGIRPIIGILFRNGSVEEIANTLINSMDYCNVTQRWADTTASKMHIWWQGYNRIHKLKKTSGILKWIVSIFAMVIIIYLIVGLSSMFILSYYFPDPSSAQAPSKGAAIYGGLIGAGASLLLTPMAIYFFRKRLEQKNVR